MENNGHNRSGGIYKHLKTAVQATMGLMGFFHKVRRTANRTKRKFVNQRLFHNNKLFLHKVKQILLMPSLQAMI
jgi:hypothetical protein